MLCSLGLSKDGDLLLLLFLIISNLEGNEAIDNWDPNLLSLEALEALGYIEALSFCLNGFLPS